MVIARERTRQYWNERRGRRKEIEENGKMEGKNENYI